MGCGCLCLFADTDGEYDAFLDKVSGGGGAGGATKVWAGDREIKAMAVITGRHILVLQPAIGKNVRTAVPLPCHPTQPHCVAVCRAS